MNNSRRSDGHMTTERRSGLSPSAQGADRWDCLDRFARDVAGCRDITEATGCFLRAAREALGADAVFCCSTNEGAKSDLMAYPSMPASSGPELIRLALAETPGVESQLLRAAWLPPPSLGLPPCSLVMVRLSRSKALWAVGLSFDPSRPFRPADATLLGVARHLLLGAWKHHRTEGRFRHSLLGLIHGFTAAIDGRDRHSAGRSARVARIAVRLGEELRLPAADLGDLYLAGLLHDIGKVGISDRVLQKPGRLTDEEKIQVMEHAPLGAAIVAGVPSIAHLGPVIRAHHERYDGRGYPDGLAGESIPLLARILAVADSFDALLTNRPYRPALPVRELEPTLTAGAGTQWDARVVQAALSCRDDLANICRRPAQPPPNERIASPTPQGH